MIEEALFQGPSPRALAGFAAGRTAYSRAGGMGVA